MNYAMSSPRRRGSRVEKLDSRLRGNDLFLMFALVMMFFFISCTPRNAGQLTLVNSGVTTDKISVDGRTFTVFPSNHITKDVSEGIRKIKVNDLPVVEVKVTRGLTTLFDTTGLSCYVVADFSPRSKGGNPFILERFEKLRTFTTSIPMGAVLGSIFPKKKEGGSPLTRIHQIDCEIIGNDAEIISEIKDFQ